MAKGRRVNRVKFVPRPRPQLVEPAAPVVKRVVEDVFKTIQRHKMRRRVIMFIGALGFCVLSVFLTEQHLATRLVVAKFLEYGAVVLAEEMFGFSA